MKKNYAMLILTGGAGTRLRPLTNNFNKASMPIYYDEDGIKRIIDIPLSFCKSHGYPVYVHVNNEDDTVIETVKKYDNARLVVFENKGMFLNIQTVLRIMHADGIEYYSCYASDFIVTHSTIERMIEACSDPVISVNLVAKENDYASIVMSADEDGYLTYDKDAQAFKDLTFNVRNVKDALYHFDNYDPNKSFMENLYPEDQIKDRTVLCLLGKEKHIDSGTPEAIYDLIYELNKGKQDKNGNICFPGSRINPNSSNIIAFPNSDSQDVTLSDCIVPENETIDSSEKVLKLEKKKKLFSHISIKDIYK